MAYEWIEKEIGSEHGAKSEFARAIGIGSDQVSKIFSGTRAITMAEGIKIAKYFRKPVSWIIDGSMRWPLIPDDAVRGITAIPVYDVRASAGHGNLIVEENVTYHLSFRTDWLRQVSRAPIEKLCVISVDGDSMQPTLSPEDTVLVDLTQVALRKDGIYVLRYDGVVLVKRIQYDPQRRLVRILSDNSLYPPIEITEPDGLAVIGRVIWLGRRV